MLRYGNSALPNLQQNLGREESKSHSLVKTKSGLREPSWKETDEPLCAPALA